MEQSRTEVATDARGGSAPALLVLAFLSLVGGQLPSFTTRANLYTICLGGSLLWLGLAGRGRRPEPARLGPGTAWWLVPVAIFVLFEASTFVLGSMAAYPTFSKLADPLLEDEVLRSAAYFAWLTGFWALVRR
ncbi:hypothetical protein AB0J74_29905 [Asanoa sp. NPDC049573]|uniref:hypothetical protein n=1 Tax=Asanoa sp. NPDC049573 TaxID=3155396 RepID=UPI003420BEB7